jgi:hypothetical protein
MCVTSFTHMRSATRWFRVRERHFLCNVCKRSFTIRFNLDNNIRVHTGDRPFSYELCRKSFAQKSGVKRHIKLHTWEKLSRAKCVRNGSLSYVTGIYISEYTLENDLFQAKCVRKSSLSSIAWRVISECTMENGNFLRSVWKSVHSAPSPEESAQVTQWRKTFFMWIV